MNYLFLVEIIKNSSLLGPVPVSSSYVLAHANTIEDARQKVISGYVLKDGEEIFVTSRTIL